MSQSHITNLAQRTTGGSTTCPTPMTTPTLCLMLLLMADLCWLSRSGLGGDLNGDKGRQSLSKYAYKSHGPFLQPTNSIFLLQRKTTANGAAAPEGASLSMPGFSPIQYQTGPMHPSATRMPPKTLSMRPTARETLARRCPRGSSTEWVPSAHRCAQSSGTTQMSTMLRCTALAWPGSSCPSWFCGRTTRRRVLGRVEQARGLHGRTAETTHWRVQSE